MSYIDVVTTPEPPDPTPRDFLSRYARAGCRNRVVAYLVIIGVVVGVGFLAYLAVTPSEQGEDGAMIVATLFDRANTAARSGELPGGWLPEDGPVYSVQPLANVDAITAGSTLNSIMTMGFSGFDMVRDWKYEAEAYDLFRSGLTFDEALQLEQSLIEAGIIVQYDLGPGFYVRRSDNLR